MGKYLLIIIGIITLALVGCSPDDPALDSFYTEGGYYIRDANNQWVALANTDITGWNDLRVAANDLRVPGARPPTWTDYKGGQVLAFADQAVEENEEIVYFVAQIPHSYQEGTNIYPHVHWVAEDNTGGNVRWRLTYSWANRYAVLPAENTVYVNATASTTTDVHNFASFGPLAGSGKTISSMLICSLSPNSFV